MENQDSLKLQYSELNTIIRNLVDIRFKLLGFVPSVSLLAWAEIYKNIPPNSCANIVLGVVVALLGLIVCLGIRVYDLRNTEVYSHFAKKLIDIEFILKTGILVYDSLPHNKVINHEKALKIIYWCVFIGWGLLILWYASNLCKVACLCSFPQ
jgi:hypothetical protein